MPLTVLRGSDARLAAIQFDNMMTTSAAFLFLGALAQIVRAFVFHAAQAKGHPYPGLRVVGLDVIGWALVLTGALLALLASL